MKKFLAGLLAAVLTLSLTACGGAKELTGMDQVKDLATGTILQLGKSTQKDVEKLYGTGTENGYGYTAYQGETVLAAYEENGVLHSLSYLDDSLFESLAYHAGMTYEETEKALFVRYPQESEWGVTLGAAFNAKNEPCYSNSEDVLCLVSVEYTPEHRFQRYYIFTVDLSEAKEVVPAGAYQEANTILPANLDAAKLAIKAVDQVLDFELTYEEASAQVSRLCDRMEDGNSLNHLLKAEMGLLSTRLDSGAYEEKVGRTPNDSKILEQRNVIAKEIGEEQR